MKNKTCCIMQREPRETFCRENDNNPSFLQFKKDVAFAVEREITENRVTHFIASMTLGINMTICEILLAYKKKYPHITFEATIPYLHQSDSYTDAERMRYMALIDQCDKATVMENHYCQGIEKREPRYMIDASDAVIAIWGGEATATVRVMLYADEKKKRIVLIDTKEESENRYALDKLSILPKEVRTAYLMQSAGENISAIKRKLGCRSREVIAYCNRASLLFHLHKRKVKAEMLKKELAEMLAL